MTINFSTVNSKFGPDLYHLTIDNFDLLLKTYFGEWKTVTFDEREKEKLIIGTRFKPHHIAKRNVKGNYSRCTENVLDQQILILDVDNSAKTQAQKITWDEAVQHLQGINCYFYSSFNDRNPDKDDGVDKFRIVIELSEPVSLKTLNAETGKTGISGAFQMMFPWAAPESFKPSQPFFMKLQDPTRTHLSRELRIVGEPLNWKLLEPAVLCPNGRADDGSATPIPSLPQLLGKDADTYIKMLNGQQTTVSQLFYSLNEGYEYRKPCYSTLREESRPSSFAYRDGRYLVMQDFGANRQRVRYEIEELPFKSDDDLTELLKAMMAKRKTATN